MAPGVAHPQLSFSAAGKLMGTEDLYRCTPSAASCTDAEQADDEVRRCERCGHEIENLSGDDLCGECAEYNDGRVVL